MQISHDLKTWRQQKNELCKKGDSLGFVPTMGALHAGHLSLVEKAKQHCDRTVMSIFVNPTQFAPTEDFALYPRPIEKDIELAKQAGVDLLFIPSPETIYTETPSIRVRETHFSQHLCGKFRPSFFEGICTVVCKLLQIVQPSHLILGQKDAQQVRILQSMCSQLFFPTEVLVGDIIREENGLAMSSRNRYLCDAERKEAASIYASLQKAKLAFETGERETQKILGLVTESLQTSTSVEPQYVELCQWSDFSQPSQIKSKSLLAIAAFIGKTRLIDNILLEA